MGEEPEPDYVHFSSNSSIKCCQPVHINNEYFLLIGNHVGVCSLFSLQSNTIIATVHEDKEERQIVGVGQIENGDLFIHIRSYEVLRIRAKKSIRNILSFDVVNKWSTSYCGFCAAISCTFGLLIPSDMAQLKLIKGDSEQIIDLCSNELKNCGTLTCFATILSNFILSGFENGTLAVTDIESSDLIDKVEAFRKPILASAVHSNYIVVSSVASPLKTFHLDDNKLIELNSIPFPQTARGCGSLCFSPCGKLVASGYWDGSVRVHSLRSGKIRACITLHSNLINHLCWCNVETTRILFVASDDCKLSIWNLHKDR
ncbi:unnamed protein product [Anisakis simplex]|uniref:WD_REPEATS_REGION domain-containing protein n=1 Tax=Anisakis simplex TaxID=6269 RepID=A0A0M3JZ82_ANISI|nr:unnamed protein product [Anisakis simplex]